MKVARFAGVVDVPLFSAPDLNITDYVGFDAQPRFSGNCRVPMFSYQPQVKASNDSSVNRVVSIIPNITAHSELLKNPASIIDMAGMDFRQNWIDGSLYLLSETGITGTNYTWKLWRCQQSRAPGQVELTVPPYWFIDNSHPLTGTPQNRIEFQTTVLGGFDALGGGNCPLMLYCWNNAYNRVYVMVLTDAGLKARNGFSALTLPGATWLNTVSGSATAFCKNSRTNSATFGWENVVTPGSTIGVFHDNYIWVGKGLKTAPLVVNFQTAIYDPDAIDQIEPRWDYVSFDDAAYTAALANTQDAQGYKDGWIFTLLMNGTGKTGERQEVVVVDPIFNQYYVLRFVAQNPLAQSALKTTTTTYSVKIDTEGTVWFYNGGSPGFKDLIFNSWSPALFFNPAVINFDLPAIAMPCYNTCLPGYI